ncbi:MAG: hypothetical protein IH600_10510 [Bacteroidetes bacterium]|nr:hypothetical protein [Bacteroidota bacterium]
MRLLLLLLFLGFAATAAAQSPPASLELYPITGSSTEVRIGARMAPQLTVMNIEAVSVAVAYDPSLLSVNANTSIVNRHFSQYGWDNGSNAEWDNDGINPDVAVYAEYHPTFGSQAIFRGAPPTLCQFVFFPKSSSSGCADFTVYANNATAALTYYFEYQVSTQQNFSPVTNIVCMPYPVELSLFTAAQQGRAIAVRWATESESNNHGFHIERRDLADAAGDWAELGFVEGEGDSPAGRQYIFFDQDLPHDGDFAYRLKQVDFDGTSKYTDAVIVHYVDAPLQFALRQNYPNPVSLSDGAATHVGYDVAESSDVRLTVTNLLGQQVALLAENIFDAGSYTVDWRPAGVPAGTYIVTMTARATESGRAEVLHQRIQVIR